MKVLVGFGMVLGMALAACGTYSSLKPGAQAVTATTARPRGKCESLGNVTGKGGGASGGYVSNEDLIQYAITDLRNKGAERGATHVVYSAPVMGGNQGTTTSAMVIGEALKCEEGSEPAERTASGTGTEVASARPEGCQFDTQCKGERVCVEHQCVEPAAKANKSDTAAATGTAPPAPTP